jgi:hypothetical protein
MLVVRLISLRRKWYFRKHQQLNSNILDAYSLSEYCNAARDQSLGDYREAEMTAEFSSANRLA